MTVRQYTTAQLLALRESPLVVKPDNLPAIEQWIDESATAQPQQPKQQQRQQQRVSGTVGAEGSPMGSFSTGRPTLGTRGSTLRNGEDISLGPPKTMFPSSRNVSRLSDLPDRNAAAAGDATSAEEPESARSRFFSDRQLNRRSMNNEKEGRDGRDNRDVWTSVREKREKQTREEGDGRNGFGERQENNRWSRDDRRNGDRAGGWREREQQRRDRERDHAEKEPEWMDDPVVKKDQELGFAMPKTQEEFQKWKESMSKKAKGEPEKEEEPAQPEPAPPQPAPEPKPAVAPLKLDGFEGGMFSGWGAGNTTAGSQGATTPGASGTVKSATGKPKASRFASMFNKPTDETPPTPSEQSSSQQAANGSANKTTAEDQEGFNRVLQMLGSAKLGQPTPPQAEQTPASPPPPLKTSGINGTAPGKPKSRFTDLFSPKSPERHQSPQQSGVQLGDSVLGSEANGPNSAFGRMMPERQMSEQQIPRSQAPQSIMSPDPSGIPFNALREQQPRPASGRTNDPMFDSPSRNAASPDVNIQNLLAQNRQRQHGSNNESQQLLNLLRKDTSSSRPASQQAIPHTGGMDHATLHQWIENQQRAQIPTETHAPKPRVPQQPPGVFEEQLMRNYPTEHQQRQEPPQMPPGLAEAQRRPAQRPPPGFYDQESIFLQQQQQAQMRRQYADGPPPQQQMPGAGRRPSGHPNLPQMQIPQGQPFPPSDFHHLTSPTGAQGPPPPGFNPHMQRQPPGFHNMNIFQQPQQREGPPPGFGGMQSPPAANGPPGFFGPQGIPPGFPMQAQQMRSPVDGMPPQNRGRGFIDGFDPSIAMGPRR